MAALVAAGFRLCRFADPVGAGRLSFHLLLLPRRLLQSFLGGPAVLRGRRTAESYRGERSFPLILQNVHRYFLYLALFFLVLLALDVWRALWFVNPDTGATEFGIGVGTLVLAVNVVLLGGYTLGCHSLRHLVGGRLR